MNEEKIRCGWCLKFEQYIKYHDEEWGVPVHNDQTHFEFLILEGAQAGLSWSTILKNAKGIARLLLILMYKKLLALLNLNLKKSFSIRVLFEIV